MTRTRQSLASIFPPLLLLLVLAVPASFRADGTVLVRIDKRQARVPPSDVVSQMQVVQELDRAWLVRLPVDLVPRLRSFAHDVFDPSTSGDVLFVVSATTPADIESLQRVGAAWRLDANSCLLVSKTEDVREQVPSHLGLKRLPDSTGLRPTFQRAGMPVAVPRSTGRSARFFLPQIAQMVAEVDSGRLAATIRRLEGFQTRFASTANCEAAANFLFDSFAALPLTTERDPFTFGTYAATNIVATLPGRTSPEQVVLVTAHYDSYSSNAAIQAPGADDNASGTAVVVELARVLSSRPFDFTIKFVAFSAEEFGLYGSRHYAQSARSAGEKIIGVVNLDMVGYVDVAPEDLDLIVNQKSTWLANTYVASVEAYAPMPTRQVVNASLTYSDHAPFWDQGYSALCGIEDYNTPNPNYHKPSDTFATLNMEFETSVARAALATVASLAQPVSWPPAPGNLTAQAQTHSSLFIRARNATLTWSPSSGAASYNVYRSVAPHGAYGTSVRSYQYVGHTAGTSYTDRFLTLGTTYYYVVTAVDGSGAEGNYSAEVVVTPSPGSGPRAPAQAGARRPEPRACSPKPATPS